MNSAGNDIVALNMTDPGRSQFPGFYKKILAPSEQALYHREAALYLPFAPFLWLLWSIKESAYKYAKRNAPGLVFSPTKIITEHLLYPADGPGNTPVPKDHGTPEAFYRGRVRTGTAIFYSRSFIQGDCIFSMASHTEDFSGVRWGLRHTGDAGYAQQSRAVRASLLEHFRSLFPGSEWQVGKEPEGCPILLKEGKPSGIPVSFAHHGPYVGYSYCM